MERIESNIFLENELTKVITTVRISIPINVINTYYEYPKVLDADMEQDGTKVICNDGSSFVLLMNYNEFERIYEGKVRYQELQKNNIRIN